MSNKLSPDGNHPRNRMREPAAASARFDAPSKCSLALRALFHNPAEKEVSGPSEDHRRARIEFLRASIRAGTYHISDEQIAEAMLNHPADLWT